MADLLLILRRLLRSPREMVGVVLTLSIGVGVVCAAWTVINGVLRPLPYPDPSRIVRIWSADPGSDGTSSSRFLVDHEFDALRSQASQLAGIAVYAPADGEVVSPATGVRRRVRGLAVSSGFFRVLGVTPKVGRGIVRDDEGPGTAAAIVVSERLRAAGVVRDRLGDRLEVDGASYRIVGVMPSSFHFPDPETDFWIAMAYPGGIPPVEAGSGPVSATTRGFRAIGRLVPETTPAAAESEATSILTSSGGDQHIEIRGYRDVLTASVRTPLRVLQIAALFVLVLACGNAAWLFAWRARRLDASYAVMGALGASPVRVFAAQLVEALVAALLATPGALLVAWALIRLLLSRAQGYLPRIWAVGLTLDGMVSTLLVAAVSMIVAALPAAGMVARTAARRDVLGRRRPPRGRRFREAAAMAMQVGVVFALATQAVLLTLVLGQLVGSRVGMERTDFLVARMRFPPGAALDARGQAVRYRELRDALKASGVTAATSSVVPLGGVESMTDLRTVSGAPRSDRMVGVRRVSPSYFGFVGMRLAAGRSLARRDDGRPRVAVNETLARRLFRGPEAAVGERVILGPRSDPPLEIVGVTRSVRYRGLLREPAPEVYVLEGSVPVFKDRGSAFSFLLASPRGGVEATAAQIRQVVGKVLPEVEIRRVRPFGDLVWSAAGERALLTACVGVLASIALGLMLAGFYGMTSEAVARRAREIAIRLAVGATPRRVTVESVERAMAVYGAGLVLGLALFLVSRRVVETTVFVPSGLSDPGLLTVAGTAAVVVGLVVVVACYRPVRRAARTDPVATLNAQ